MQIIEQRLTDTRAFISKTYQIAKVKLWVNETNRITVIFVVTAVLMALFAYSLYANRHYAISASSQRAENQKLKQKYQTLAELTNKINTLREFEGQFAIDEEFKRRVKHSGIFEIEHEAQLLSNCTKQFHWDEAFLDKCNHALNEFLAQLENSKDSL